jgi:hypothetical protein
MAPISTDLDISPYWDTSQQELANGYVQVLYKPAVAVQTRELNVLQSLLQAQVERFGDSIYQQGSIVSGCNFNFLPSYPYAQINDVDIFGVPVSPSSYLGYFVTNQAGLAGFVIDYTLGFQSTPPNLMTLYVRYNNSGNNFSTYQFSSGDTLTVEDANSSLWAVQVVNAGAGFSNSNYVVFTPAVAVNVTSGSFTNGAYVSQPGYSANLQIINVDAQTLATQGQLILYLEPRAVDLANNSLRRLGPWSTARQLLRSGMSGLAR